jgi:UDP-glucose 4-epimerase
LKIAITGVAGFIGSNLALRLLARGDEVQGIDDLSHGQLRNLDGVDASGALRFHQGSILDRAALDRAVAGCEVMVHLAAGKIPRYGDALDTLTINGQGGLEVLHACREAGVRRVVLASTSDCFGRNRAVPFSEESDSVIGSPKVRRWAYAVSKMFEEQAVLAFRERYGMEGVILRLFGVYGPRQNVTWWGGPQSVFIGCALRGEAMEIHGSGEQTRCFTYVDDVVESFVRAIDTPAADGEVVNVGIDEETTILGLARQIWSLVRDDEPRLSMIPLSTFGRYEDVQRRVPDNRKAGELLGFLPLTRLAQGLPTTIEWQRLAMETAAE